LKSDETCSIRARETNSNLCENSSSQPDQVAKAAPIYVAIVDRADFDSNTLNHSSSQFWSVGFGLAKVLPQEEADVNIVDSKHRLNTQFRASLRRFIVSIHLRAFVVGTYVAASWSGPSLLRAEVFHVGVVRQGSTVGDVVALVEAVNRASRNNEDDEIILEPGAIYALTKEDNNADGPNGLPTIRGVITISAGDPVTAHPAPTTSTVIKHSGDINAPFRIFHVSTDGALLLQGVTISGGSA